MVNNFFYHEAASPVFKQYILFRNKMHELSETETSYRQEESETEFDEPVQGEVGIFGLEEEPVIDSLEEEPVIESGSLFLPIAGLFVVLFCEMALLMTSLSYGYGISTPKEL
ncbi:MAG: hypothetical protein VKK63_07645 [Synechococcus sp.]|nr:hypothetical protein [Synechococcus sp.]